MVDYRITYIKDGVEKEYTYTFDNEPSFTDIEALKANFEYDEITNYFRESA